MKWMITGAYLVDVDGILNETEGLNECTLSQLAKRDHPIPTAINVVVNATDDCFYITLLEERQGREKLQTRVVENNILRSLVSWLAKDSTKFLPSKSGRKSSGHKWFFGSWRKIPNIIETSSKYSWASCFQYL